MILGRTTFFLILAVVCIVPFAGRNIWWLIRSEKATGEMRFMGKDFAGQLPVQYPIIRFRFGKDTLWFRGPSNIMYQKGELVPVRYQKKDPADARVATFAGIWVTSLIIASPFLLILLITYLHPLIVPRQSKIALVRKKPFLRLV